MSTRPTDRTAGDILRGLPDEAAARVLRRTLELLQLQETIRLALGPPLSSHVHLAAADAGALLLFADSPAWAARLRYQTAAVLAAAGGARSLRVKVAPKPPGPGPAADPPGPSMSPATARLLEQAAAGAGDPALCASLLKLSANGRD